MYQNKGEVEMSSVLCSMMIVDTNIRRAAMETVSVNVADKGKKNTLKLNYLKNSVWPLWKLNIYSWNFL